MHTGTITNKTYTFTIVLLCIGYFIDFYDLTIFSASYSDIIKDLFHIYDTKQIQLFYLKTTNYHTAGIICGGILFGILGDKYGRTLTIRYSILLYSIAILASCITHSIIIFTFLRFITGVGLATEFATSSVLISEMLPQHLKTKFTAWLYCSGILGGIIATFLSVISWRVMFIFGGGTGVILYFLRKSLFESPLFLKLPHTISRGNSWKLFNSPSNLLKILNLVILILPFYFMISIMFILPSFMPLSTNLSSIIHILLIGFFAGNLLTTLASYQLINKMKDFRPYFIINSIIFALTLSIFSFIHQQYFFIYALLLGCIGGGLPTIWIQVVTKSYGTNNRNTATNILYIIGRGSSIGFNILISYWLIVPKNFIISCIITILIITIASIWASLMSKNVYASKIDYLE